MAGEVIADRYELEELVGSGGMSSVYRAHDRLLERKVALKILHPHYTEDEEYVERFRREARAVAQLSHPNIVTVIDRGEEDGKQFIVFEYVDGQNLKEHVEEVGPLPVRRAIELGLEMARALGFAHQHGLVHRDVKPQNVLLNGDGRAKVTDFGIARSLDVEHGVTQTGTVLGTSNYIAPEQARGERVDAQSDVYSLGVVLWELLTGEVPFPGDNFVAVAMRHINETPRPVDERRSDVPPRLADAIDRALAKQPEERWASMEALIEELESCLAELEVTRDPNATAIRTPVPPAARRRPPRRPGRRRSVWPLLFVATGLAALAIVAALALRAGVDDPRGSSTDGSSVSLAGIGAHDPFGRDGEHDDEAPLATDGSLDTAWDTQSYRATFQQLGKDGVGIVLDAGQPVELASLIVSTGSPGFQAEIQAGSAAAGPFTTVSPGQTVGASTTYEIDGEPARYYVVWITELAPGESRAEIAEVKAEAS